MVYYLLKMLVSAGLIVAISELAKRSTFLAALVASLPLVSLISFVWLYFETGDTQKIASLSLNIFWLVLPSLVLFVALNLLLREGYRFFPALLFSCAVTVSCYLIALAILKWAGVRL